MRARNRKSQGYTLIEIIVVVAIIGLLSLITVPQFVNFQRSGKMKTALRNFTLDLRSARQRAITQNVMTRVTVFPSANETLAARIYVFEQSADNGTTWTPLAIRGGFGSNVTAVAGQGTGNRKRLESAVWFSASTFPGNRIVFSPNGTVAVAAGGVSYVKLKTKWKIRDNEFTVNMTPTGQIRAVGNK